MAPIILDILIVAVIALFGFLGWRKGLVLTLCGLLAVFVAYAAATFVSRTFSADVAGIVQPTIQNQLEQVLTDTLQLPSASTTQALPGSSPAHTTDPVDQLTLDQVLNGLNQSDFLSGLQQTVTDAVREGLIQVATTACAAISAYLALQIAQTLLFYLTFFVVLLAWGLFSRALDLACRLPVLRAFNEIGGAIVGVVKGALILLAVVWFLSAVGLVSQETIEQTYLFRLYMNFQLL